MAGSDLFAAATIRHPQSTTRNPQYDNPTLNDADPPRQSATGNRQPQSATPYSPWPTFAPRGWLPFIEERDDRWRLGGTVTGYDVLQRHVATVSATWAVTGGSDASALVPAASAGLVGVGTGTHAGSWCRLQAQATARPSSTRSIRTEASSRSPSENRTWREASIARSGASSGRRRCSAKRGSIGSRRIFPAHAHSVDRTALAAAWTIDTTRRYGYSVSAEHGIRAGVTAEGFKETGDDDRTAQDFTADVRAYVPLGFSRAVLALRAAGGASSGAPGVRRLFRLGGNDGDPSPGTFGDDAVSLLRGFENGEFAGTHVALANLEARIPLGWPQRGWGTWPIFFRNVHATAFADVGNAWRDTARWADAKVGAGGELSTDVVVFYGVPLTWTAGIAWGHDGAGVVPDQRSVYFRVGRSF